MYPLIKSLTCSSLCNDCTGDIKFWVTLNKLKLRDNKTETMIVSSGRKSRSLSFSFSDSVTVGSSSVPLSDSVKNLGVTLDYHLTMKTQVSSFVHSANFELRRISSICHLLSTVATKTVVSAFVLSRLDYCNSLFLAVLSISYTNYRRFRTTLLALFGEFLKRTTLIFSSSCFSSLVAH